MTQTPQIGHNNPPKQTPFEAFESHINDLYDEAKQWLDGEPVTTQEQADALNTLEANVRQAAKDAEALRKEMVKPHDDAKAEIQAKFNPLIGNTKAVTGKTVKAIEAIKAALKPYLIELDRQQREAAKLAREEAERKEREAVEALRQSDVANLADRDRAEALLKDAKAAEQAAIKAENAKAHAKGEGRATGLRTVYVATMTDEKAAAAWAWINHRTELLAFVQDQANKAVRSGARSIDGFEITETKVL